MNHKTPILVARARVPLIQPKGQLLDKGNEIERPLDIKGWRLWCVGADRWPDSPMLVGSNPKLWGG